MNSALAGILSGVSGGASKYGQLKDEQRQFGLDQKAAQQAQMRKESFAKFQYSLQDSQLRFKDSGRAATNAQADAAPKGALEGVDAINARAKEEATLAADVKSKAAQDEKRKYQEGLIAEADAKKAVLLEAKLKREEAAAKKKEDKEAEKAKTDKEKDFVEDSKAEIYRMARESGDDGLVAQTDAAYNFALDNRDNPMVKLVPAVVSAVKTRSNVPKFEALFEKNKGFWSSRAAELAKTREQLFEDGMSKLDIERAEEYLRLQGKLK